MRSLLWFVLCTAPLARAEEPARAPDAEERQLIGDTVRARLGSLRKCARVDVRGKVMARFDIAADGKVENAAASGAADQALLDCLAGEIARWEFTNPARARLRVAYPLVFAQN